MSSTDEPTRGNVPEFRRGAGSSPAWRAKRLVLAAVAVLAIALATAAAVIAVQQPPSSPRGLVATLSGPDGQGTCSAAFSPDGRTLAVADCGDSIFLWDMSARRWAGTLTSPRCPRGGQVGFSPDGKTLALFSGGELTTCLWNLATRRETTLTDPGPRPYVAWTQGTFSPGGTTLAVADTTRDVYLWNLADGRVAATVPVPGAFDHSVMAALSPDGALLAVSVSFGYGTYLYDVGTAHRVATLTDPGGKLSQAAPVVFSPDGAMLAVTDPNGRTYLWRTAIAAAS
jgi:WD40 repeat protein